jgi:hypothetical protein
MLQYQGEEFDDSNCRVQCDNCNEHRPQSLKKEKVKPVIVEEQLEKPKVHEDKKYKDPFDFSQMFRELPKTDKIEKARKLPNF